MEKKITITIKDDIYDKFCLALNLSKEEEAKAVETCFKWYIAKSFGKVIREFEQEVDENPVGGTKTKGNFYGKAAKRIPLWANHPEQYCHKIIRGFFLLQEQKGQVLLQELEQLCTNEAVPELYVLTFRSNYYQMKLDGVKTYGKVFEDDGKEVRIWSEIEGVLAEYKSQFLE